MTDLRNAQAPEEFLDDIEEATNQGPTPEQMAAVVNKARELLKADRRVDDADKELKEAKEARKIIQQVELPKLMKDATMTECPLGNGWTVELDKLVTASVPSPEGKAVNARERHEKGIAYLDDVAPDLVKHTVTIKYARGQEKQLKKLLTNLAKYKPPVEVDVAATVHAQTLGKWVRTQDKLGKAVDEDALGVNRIDIAELVAPAKPKGVI